MPEQGITADGIFGSGTEAAMKAFQKANGLDPDGMAGPATLSKMSAFAEMVTEEVVTGTEVQPDEKHSGKSHFRDWKRV